jgi:UDP-N-acetylmuramoylalanine--D-glutamate ligase
MNFVNSELSTSKITNFIARLFQTDINYFMSKPISFEFTSYKFLPSQKRIIFRYQFNFNGGNPLKLTEEIILPRVPQAVPAELLKNLLSSAHLALGVSYYKLYCPKKVIYPYQLTAEQAQFFTTVYKKGLGELYYRNKLNPANSPVFELSKTAKTRSTGFLRKSRALVGIGGGKDSIVVAELMKRAEQKFSALVMETGKPSPIIGDVIKIIGVDKLILNRQLDEKLFESYPDTYNGHIPFNAVLAFVGLIGAVLYDYNEVIVGNEFSSSFGNIVYKGMEVNHQWSKSLEFEMLFQKYCRSFITPDVKYYSLLRPYYEIKIAELFTQYKKYHHLFSSCNRNFKVNRERQKNLWCGECPKCAFVFALLSAFLPKPELVKIFGKNLYADKNLLATYKDLIGAGKMKPFECVGSFEETLSAMYLAKDKFKDDYIIKTLNKKIVQGNKYVENLLKFQSVGNMPVEKRLLALDKILLLGYGKEGQMTDRYLKTRFPWLKIFIADQTISKNYLKEQAKFDFAIKTPGLPKNKVTIPYTTATNLFFSQIKNPIIGVTGSKGKSTTASLIYEMLKAGGYDVELLGNIGSPMLVKLLKPVPTSKIFVVELSSYQLEDIEHSPDVAVVTNLFPEHMNYHGGEKQYYEAKKNIINSQSLDDYFIYNDADKKLQSWAKSAKANSCGLIKNLPLDDADIPLLGKHNKDNVRMAVTVALLFGVNWSDIKYTIKKFKGLPHRLEFVGVHRGIKFYDDAISTTPESTMMAIKALPKIGTIFLGGEDRGYDFGKLEKLIRAKKIKNIVLFPDSGKKIIKSRTGLNVLETKDMKQAVEFAYQHTKQGEICLLSTASPSYSVWKNFEEKGDLFKQWIKKLK